MKKERFVLTLGFFLLLLVSLQNLANQYGEFLWFKTMGYASVFWRSLLAKGLFGLIFGAVFAFIAAINIYLARRKGTGNYWELTIRGQGINPVQTIPIKPEYVNRFLMLIGLILSILMGAWPATAKWDELLRFFYQTPFSRLDPIFQKDIGFFVFSYPIYTFIQKWLFYTLMIITVLTGFIYIKDKAVSLSLSNLRFSKRAKAHLSILVSFILLLVAWDKRLQMLGLVYSVRGVAFGASYTDMNAQVLAYWLLIIIASICAFLFWINLSAKGWKWPMIGVTILAALWILSSGIYPVILQKFVVEPNELTKEKPYLQHNIQYTRWGYNLDQIIEKDFAVSTSLTMDDIQKNPTTIRNLKLWDKNPLKQSYSQLQEMRLYYNFNSVDEDRYDLDGQKTQVMLSARELEQSNLPSEAQTFENKHFKYTHGYGLCMNPVNQVTEKGLPNLIIKDIPPQSQYGLSITRPEIYYGESNSDFVVVNTGTPEFDYPKGDDNVYTHYEGKGGVSIGSYLNRLTFSLKFADPSILLTSYIRPESRIMFHRQIRDMINTLAPFLTYDHDPYLVISKTGRLFWIQDAYTTTDKYPYSERSILSGAGLDISSYQSPLQLLLSQGSGADIINYIRNSVKIVIDAYHGTVTYYIVDEKDPIIKTYSLVFPDLFKPFSEMPEDLRAHLRYPRDLFEVQSNMYRTYHMRDAQVFYNKEDLWDLPMQKNISSQEELTMRGYYTIMRLPDHQEEEFMLMIPFTPNNKDNMIAWMSAGCDGQNYGQLMVYKLPKEKLIYGPRQVEARIDQQTEISSELTLWSQQGSEVFRGDLLVIPIEDSILYIEPIYLMSADRSNLPELKRVIIAYGDKIEMRPTLSLALQEVFGQSVSEAAAMRPPAAVRSQETKISSGQDQAKVQPLNELARQAEQYFQQGIDSLRQGDWAAYGRSQEELQRVIKQLLEASEAK